MILTLADRERLRARIKLELEKLDDYNTEALVYDCAVAHISDYGFEQLTDLALAAVLDFDPKE